jgi:hypothetical protein
MFVYCTEILGLDPGPAYNRIHVARLARRFPVVLDMLSAGQISLSGLRILAPHLTEERLDEVLGAAAGRSKRQIEEVVAALVPKPDVPDRIRKRPAPRGARPKASSPTQTRLDDLPAQPPPKPETGDDQGRGEAARTGESSAPTSPAASSEGPAPAAAPKARTREPRPPKPEPWSPGRFKIELTASAELVDQLERVRALMGYRDSGRRYQDVLGEALALLEKKLLKERFGVGAQARRRAAQPESGAPAPPRSAAEVARRAGPPEADTESTAPEVAGAGGPLSGAVDQPGPDGLGARPEPLAPAAPVSGAVESEPTKATRHVPHAVRREVFERDGLQCAYVDPETGRRCTERRVEFQHHVPYGRGGAHSRENVSNYCRAHNQYAARQDYGPAHIDAAIGRSRNPSVRDDGRVQRPAGWSGSHPPASARGTR